MLRLSMILVTFLAALYVPAQTGLKAINIAVLPDSNVLQIPAEVLSEEIAAGTGITWAVGTEPGRAGRGHLQLDPAWTRGLPDRNRQLNRGPRHLCRAARRDVAVGYPPHPGLVEPGRPARTDQHETPEYPICGTSSASARTQQLRRLGRGDLRPYIRDLTFFGTNAVENIPFQDDRQSPVMRMSREQANRTVSPSATNTTWTLRGRPPISICSTRRSALSADFTRPLPGVPGWTASSRAAISTNHPREVMPFLQDPTILPKYHRTRRSDVAPGL